MTPVQKLEKETQLQQNFCQCSFSFLLQMHSGGLAAYPLDISYFLQPAHPKPGPEKRRFPCQDCGESFVKNHHLSRHRQRKHGGVPHFKCTTCPKAYAVKDDLMFHCQRTGHPKPLLTNAPSVQDAAANKNWTGGGGGTRKAGLETIKLQFSFIFQFEQEWRKHGILSSLWRYVLAA